MGRDEEREFLNLLADKRHKELIEALSKLSVTVKSDTPSKELVKVIQDIADRKSDNKLPEGAVAISKAIIQNLSEVKSEIQKGFDKIIKSRAREWQFRVNYNDFGQLETVNAKVVE